ncbi:MAG: class I SAM-dependent methyltransferase [Heyndrickxia sp.]
MEKDNFQEYEDPILYDKENDPFTDDIPLLIKWASRSAGPIIDLACGTGRATIPLAKKGYEMIGVDIHKGMLEAAKRKADNLHLQTKWIEQDCTCLDLGVLSEFIYMVGNSFQHFLTNEDQDRLLASVNKHLKLDGIFIFGTRFPSNEELLQPSTEEFWRSYIDQENQNKVDVYTISNYDALNQIQHYITIRKYISENGEALDEKRTNIKLRYVFPKEMERVIRENGFEIVDIYKNWNEEPITNDSYQMVYVCRKT